MMATVSSTAVGSFAVGSFAVGSFAVGSFAVAQCFGALGPVIYGALIGDGSQPFKLFLGYLLGAAVMVAGGLVAWFLAVDAEGRSLEDIATPLSAGGRGRTGLTRAEGATLPT
jgi:hypothetical protein